MTCPKYIDVLLVDDHEVVREGVKTALTVPFRVVADVADASRAMRAVRELAPDVAVLDMRLPDMSGPELCARVKAASPRTAVVMLSSYFTEDAVRSALRAGASRYVSKSAGMAELRAALEEVTGDGPTTELDAYAIVSRVHGKGVSTTTRTVTAQEERVLELAAQGFTDREIGARLYLAESTVRFHLQRLKAVLGARTKTEVVAKAIRTGVLAPAVES